MARFSIKIKYRGKTLNLSKYQAQSIVDHPITYGYSPEDSTDVKFIKALGKKVD